LNILNHAIESQTLNLIAKVIYNKLSKLKNTILFVFDNVEEFDHIKDYLLHVPSNLKIIINTRNNNLTKDTRLHVKTKPFTKNEAVQLIKLRLKERIDEKDIDYLINVVGTRDIQQEVLPFKLEKAFAYIEYFEMVKIDKLISNIEFYDYAHAETALLLNLSYSEKPEAWNILKYASFLDPDMINIRIFMNLLKMDEFELQDPINVLKKFSLVELVLKDGEHGLKLHRLIQEEVQHFMNKNLHKTTSRNLIKSEIYIDLLKCLNEMFCYVDSMPDEKWKKSQLCYPHAIKILNADFEHRNESEILKLKSDLYAKVGVYANYVLVNYKASLEYFKKALELKKKVFKESSAEPDIPMLLNYIGLTYKLMGDSKTALSYLNESLAIYQKLYNNHPAIANSLNNLGFAYSDLGNSKISLELTQKAFEMRKELSNNYDIALSFNNLGSLYKRLGNFSVALSFYNQALKIYEKEDVKESSDVATCLNNIGLILNEMGRPEQAEEYIERSLSYFKSIYKTDHPNIATCMNNLGSVYDLQGDLKTALKFYKEAIKMKESFYNGAPHPDIGMSLNNIGSIYKKLDDPELALAFHFRALSVFKTLYTDDHPSVAATLNNIGSAHEQAKDLDEALDYYEKALNMYQSLGEQNKIEAALCLNNLGSVWMKLNQPESALFYLFKALEILQETFSEKHVYIATTLNNIGYSFNQLEDYETALDFFKQSFQIKKELFNENHSDLAVALSNIGYAYLKLNDKKNAMEYIQKGLRIYSNLNLIIGSSAMATLSIEAEAENSAKFGLVN
jgi:tetratricopeptide (TPR) repeat protein